jgi:glycosyltransferase involved in cell wall biosynthesis
VELSIVIPALNEEQSIPELVERTAETLRKTTYNGRFEILFVDDGSTDGTVETIRRLSAAHPYLKVAVMRANIGKAMALMVGFSKARGDIIITMDADLQDNPEDVPSLIAQLQNGGYDLVCGWRRKREDTPMRRAGSWLFNKFIHRLTGLDIRDQNCGFKAYRATLTRRLNVYGHFHRLLPMQAYLLGYSVGQAPVNNSPRKYGSSKYRTFRYEGFFDFLSVFFAVRYGYAPLHFFGILSMFFVIPGGVLLLYLIAQHFLFLLTRTSGQMLVERPLLNLSLTTILTGLIILTTGFVCDFMLYHHARTNAQSMVEFALKDVHDFGARTKEAANAERRRDG